MLDNFNLKSGEKIHKPRYSYTVRETAYTHK